MTKPHNLSKTAAIV